MRSALIVIRMALLVLMGTLALSSCSSGLAGLPTISAPPTGDYRLAAGDKLKVAVQNLDSANGEYVVEDSGSISLPLIKDIPVRGLTYRQAEDAIETAYKRAGVLNTPVVNVQPAQLRPFYVLGEVNHPGEFDYRQGMTVLAAISAAGGYTYRAKSGEVAITRNVDGHEVTARAGEDTVIRPGDRIRVFERWF